MHLNEQQIQAVNHIDGPCLVTACPGSGKTRVIVERTAKLISSGVSPSSILNITFTNKAASELRERVLLKIGDSANHIFIATFHKLASSILRYHGSHIGYGRNMSILDEDGQFDLMSQIARQKEFELSRQQILQILSNINDARENLENDDQIFSRFKKIDENFYGIAVEYIDRLHKSNSVDFSGLLSETIRLLNNHPVVLDAAQSKWKYCMVDETQDCNKAQFEIIKILFSHTKNIFIVGDLDQCQPAGTKVLTTLHGEINIEDLDPSVHKLISFSTRKSAVVGRRHGMSFEKSQREFNGYLYTIKVRDKSTQCTHNHKWTVKFKRGLENKYVIYLMRSGNCWRVGYTIAFPSYSAKCKGSFGPILRARAEKADAVWVLKIVESFCEAQLWQQIISCKYGIPSVCFTGGKCVTNGIQILYSETGNLFERVQKCLDQYELCIDYPIWERKKEKSSEFSYRVPLKIHACNLIPELMKIPIPIKCEKFVWCNFSKNRHKYNGNVYSLNVEKHEHYIADGIITHNSIYGWRGARADNLRDFTKLYDTKIISLGQNYRSTPEIVKVADKLIKHNSNRIAAPFTTSNENGPPVLCKAFMTDAEESEFVAKTIHDIVSSNSFSYKEIAVFYRTNNMSRSLELAMMSRNIPYTLIGGFSFFDRKEVKDCIAMLRFLINPMDGVAFHRICNKPKRSIGDITVGKIETFAKNNHCSIMDAINKIEITNATVQKGLHEIHQAFVYNWSNKSISECLCHLIEKLRYKDFLAEDSETMLERMDNVDELIKDAVNYQQSRKNPTIDSYLEQLTLLSSVDKIADGNSVSLQTLHSSKGLEYPVVFMVGVEDKILPHFRAMSENADGISEERRLCYVGMTRAKKQLYVTYCTRRQENSYRGGNRWKTVKPSQFLYESGLLVRNH